MKALALACVGACLLWATDTLLNPWIAASKQQAQERLALGWLDQKWYDNNPLTSPIELVDPHRLGVAQGHALLGYQNGLLRFVVLPSRVQGYAAQMEYAFALTPSGTLLATQVVLFNETPTIGDRILPNHSNWIEQIRHQNPKDYDHLAGATKTSQSFIEALNQARTYLHKYTTLWSPHEK